MTSSKTYEEAALTIIERALSIRPSLDLSRVLHGLGERNLLNTDVGIRLLLAEAANSTTSRQEIYELCLSAIPHQKAWQAICGEILRYSSPTIDCVNLFLNVLRAKAPKHPITLLMRGKSVGYVTTAYDAIDKGDVLELHVETLPPTDIQSSGFFVSIDDPINLYCGAELQTLTSKTAVISKKGGDLFAENTTIARPSLLVLTR